MKQAVFYLSLLLLSLPVSAQQPFVCKGGFYLSISPQQSSSVFEMDIDPNTGVVTFFDLAAPPVGFVLNGIGYRPTDNYIYGADSDKGDIYRIDANGHAALVGRPPGIPTGHPYPSGDVSPDGKKLVLLAVSGGQNGSSEALVYISLDDPSSPAEAIFLADNNHPSYDIAFDPLDGTLYGWDAINQQLLIFNPGEGRVEAPFASDPDAFIMGALFFDAFGRLYGYGNTTPAGSQNTLFLIDKLSGRVDKVASGPSAQRSDGCSCPYTIVMEKQVEPQQAVPCTEIKYTFEIANASGREQSALTFRDQLPEGFIITAVDNLLGGQLIAGGPGTDSIVIGQVRLPLGLSRLTITVEVPPGAIGIYRNQARLEGLPEGLGTVAVSDDPLTLEDRDSTALTIDSLRLSLRPEDTFLCPGETLTLEAPVEGVDYQWSNGSREAEISITEGGHYSLTVTSGCESASTSITVEEAILSVSLGETLQLFLGDSLELQASVIGSPPFFYQWQQDTADLKCASCTSLPIRPFDDALYRLAVTDGKGCTQVDSVWVEVRKDRRVFLPTAFSPNGDGRNDRFFPMSRRQEEVTAFRVFSRWGALLFEKQYSLTNDPRPGWDGTFRGEPLGNGIYTYQLEVKFPDGHTARFAGEVTLIR